MGRWVRKNGKNIKLKEENKLAKVETITISKEKEIAECKEIMSNILSYAIEERRSMTELEERKYNQYKNRLEELEKTDRKEENKTMDKKEFRNFKNNEELADFEVRNVHMGYNPSFAEVGVNVGESKVSTLSQTILDLLHENAVVLNYLPMQTIQGERKLPIAVNNNKKSAIVLENEQFTEKDYAVSFKSLETQKLGQMTVLSRETLEDNQLNVPAMVADQTAKDYARKLEELVLVGAVPGKAEGVLVAKGANKTVAEALTVDSLVDAFYALPKMAREKAVLIVDNDTLKALRKLKDQNGRPLMEYSTAKLGDRSAEVVFGCPVVEVEQDVMPSNTYCAFVDFQDSVFAGIGRQFNLVRDDSMKRAYDQVCYVSSMRFGQIVVDAKCISLVTNA